MRLILFLLSFVIHADLSNNIDIHKEKYEKLALEIWSLAEMGYLETCLLYTSPSPRDPKISRMPSSA